MRDDLAFLLLRATSNVVEAVHAGVTGAGFTDVRPAHGIAFARLSHGGATTGDLAVFLGVTKQATAQLVEELVAKGYAARQPHPTDRRARLVVLTDRGWAVTQAATAAGRAAAEHWSAQLGGDRFEALAAGLDVIGEGARLRPVW